MNITDKAGQNIDFSHGLGTLDWNDEGVIVEITGKTVAEGELLRRLGLQQLQAWNRTYGGADYDHARSVVQTVDGGYAIAGDTYSFGAGLSDFWLVTTDSYGNMVWNRTYEGTYVDAAAALVQTIDGGYALAGHIVSSGAEPADFWLVKTDADGDEVWNRTYGEAFGAEALALVQTIDGGYALAGYAYSSIAGIWHSDSLLVKTNSDGKSLNGEHGLTWVDSTNGTVTLYRGKQDSCWNFVRVRIMKAKE